MAVEIEEDKIEIGNKEIEYEVNREQWKRNDYKFSYNISNNSEHAPIMHGYVSCFASGGQIEEQL